MNNWWIILGVSTFVVVIIVIIVVLCVTLIPQSVSSSSSSSLASSSASLISVTELLDLVGEYIPDYYYSLGIVDLWQNGKIQNYI
jgi:CBS domain containing-hemolysin-like protein